MNFNVSVDDATGRRFDRLARRRKVARSALIREAFREFVEGAEARGAWSPAVLTWTGDPGVPPNDAARADLAPTRDDDPLR